MCVKDTAHPLTDSCQIAYTCLLSDMKTHGVNETVIKSTGHVHVHACAQGIFLLDGMLTCVSIGGSTVCCVLFPGQNTSMHLIINPLRPLALPECKFLGPDQGKLIC